MQNFAGAHTLGVSHCLNVIMHPPKKGKTVAKKFKASATLECFSRSLENITIVRNDPTSTIFDNIYYKNALIGLGLLQIDAEMPTDPRTASYVRRFAADQEAFFRAFSSAFVKLSSYGVLTGTQGTIRRRCNTID